MVVWYLIGRKHPYIFQKYKPPPKVEKSPNPEEYLSNLHLRREELDREYRQVWKKYFYPVSAAVTILAILIVVDTYFYHFLPELSQNATAFLFGLIVIMPAALAPGYIALSRIKAEYRDVEKEIKRIEPQVPKVK